MKKFYRFIETQQDANGETAIIPVCYNENQEVEAKQKYYETMKFVVASTLPYHAAELYDSSIGVILYGDNKKDN